MQKGTKRKKPQIWQPINSQLTLWRECGFGGVLPWHPHEEFQIVLNLSVLYKYNYRRSSTVVFPDTLISKFCGVGRKEPVPLT